MLLIPVVPVCAADSKVFPFSLWKISWRFRKNENASNEDFTGGDVLKILLMLGFGHWLK